MRGLLRRFPLFIWLLVLSLSVLVSTECESQGSRRNRGSGPAKEQKSKEETKKGKAGRSGPVKQTKQQIREKLLADIPILKQKTATLTKKREDLEKKVRELGNKRQSLEGSIKILNDQLQGLNHTISVSKTTKHKIEDEHQELREAIHGLESDKANLEERKKALKVEVDQLDRAKKRFAAAYHEAADKRAETAKFQRTIIMGLLGFNLLVLFLDLLFMRRSTLHPVDRKLDGLRNTLARVQEDTVREVARIAQTMQARVSMSLKPSLDAGRADSPRTRVQSLPEDHGSGRHVIESKLSAIEAGLNRIKENLGRPVDGELAQINERLQSLQGNLTRVTNEMTERIRPLSAGIKNLHQDLVPDPDASFRSVAEYYRQLVSGLSLDQLSSTEPPDKNVEKLRSIHGYLVQLGKLCPRAETINSLVEELQGFVSGPDQDQLTREIERIVKSWQKETNLLDRLVDADRKKLSNPHGTAASAADHLGFRDETNARIAGCEAEIRAWLRKVLKTGGGLNANDPQKVWASYRPSKMMSLLNSIDGARNQEEHRTQIDGLIAKILSALDLEEIKVNPGDRYFSQIHDHGGQEETHEFATGEIVRVSRRGLKDRRNNTVLIKPSVIVARPEND